jgi:hypothetical protein
MNDSGTKSLSQILSVLLVLFFRISCQLDIAGGRVALLCDALKDATLTT